MATFREKTIITVEGMSMGCGIPPGPTMPVSGTRASIQARPVEPWNENVTVATRDGHIAYFHPGLFPRRSGMGNSYRPIFAKDCALVSGFALLWMAALAGGGSGARRPRGDEQLKPDLALRVDPASTFGMRTLRYFVSAAVLTYGTITPIAPMSRTRLKRGVSFIAIRTTGNAGVADARPEWEIVLILTSPWSTPVQ